MHNKIIGLPGDGIGPEIYASAMNVLSSMDELFDLNIEVKEYDIGGIAIDKFGSPLPDETLSACKQANAILMGAIGGPKWDHLSGSKRPEAGLLGLRKHLGLYANLRPVVMHDSIAHLSPLKTERLKNVDLLIVRELTGGMYFGEKSVYGSGPELTARDVCEYSVLEIERIARLGFQLARDRRKYLTSVDKANVLETSRLWRETVTRIGQEEFPDVTLSHVLVDAAAMYLISEPGQFDVLLTENLFGDILSDEASMLSGSLGVLPSASVAHQKAEKRTALYEPIHGSAPDIAGQDKANPAGMLLSLAMLLRHSLNRPDAATALEQAVFSSWENKVFTADLNPLTAVGTREFTHSVLENIIRKRAYPNTMLRYM